ncbi:hypothetical protein SMICM17S_01656 [Streptomyces microflavus]
MRRGRVVAAVAAVLAVTAGTIAVTQLGGAEEPAGSRNTGLPPATAPVERGDLRDSAQADGTLGYDKQRKINSGAAGTLTWTPRTGSTSPGLHGDEVCRRVVGARLLTRILMLTASGTVRTGWPASGSAPTTT